MDAAVCTRRSTPMRTAKSCGPGPPTLGSSLAVMFRRTTVAKKPGHRGEHEAAVNTIAQGMPVAG